MRSHEISLSLTVACKKISGERSRGNRTRPLSETWVCVCIINISLGASTRPKLDGDALTRSEAPYLSSKYIGCCLWEGGGGGGLIRGQVNDHTRLFERACLRTCASLQCRCPLTPGAIVGLTCSASPNNISGVWGQQRGSGFGTLHLPLFSPHLSWCKQRHTPDTHTHTHTPGLRGLVCGTY